MRQVPRVTLQCRVCGKEISKTQKQVARGLGHFCSASCRSKYYPHRNPIGTEFRERVIVPCARCGKPMRLLPADAASGHKFCSRACVNAGREHPERRKPKVVKYCLSCGREYLSYPSTAERHQYCSRQCLGYATQVRQARSETTIETALLTELRVRGVACEGQYRQPPWLIDVAIPSRHLAIEADGTYWHSLEAAQRRDARKNADLAARGWTVLRFTEAEIRESAARCIDKVMQYLA